MSRNSQYFITVVLSLPALLLADTIAPLQMINNNPAAQIFGLPFIGEAKLLAAGEQTFSLVEDVSSIYVDRRKGNEDLFMDGEVSRSNFVYRLGVGADQEWQLVIPYVSHSGGGLDGFIDDWHNLFHLPKSGRQNFPHNQLLYLYRRDAEDLLNFSQATEGLGDIRLLSSWQLERQVQPSELNTALSVSLKLPTGDTESLTGSGAADLAVWVRREQARTFFTYPGGLFYSSGMLLMGKSDVLADIHDSFALFGGLGLGVRFRSALQLIAQLDMHSALYSHSDLPELGGPAAQLSLGGRYAFTRRINLDFGIAEDLLIDASPDITMHLDLTLRVD